MSPRGKKAGRCHWSRQWKSRCGRLPAPDRPNAQGRLLELGEELRRLASLSQLLEGIGELDQRWLAVGRPKEEQILRQPTVIARGHTDDRIPGTGGLIYPRAEARTHHRHELV